MVCHQMACPDLDVSACASACVLPPHLQLGRAHWGAEGAGLAPLFPDLAQDAYMMHCLAAQSILQGQKTSAMAALGRSCQYYDHGMCKASAVT